jgi:hypothetical protein
LAGIIKRKATVGQVPMFIEISVSAAMLEKKRAQAGNLQFADYDSTPWSNGIIFKDSTVLPASSANKQYIG